MDLSIIIVHYNTPELTRACIESIYKETEGLTFEIIVIDNASTSHDVNELRDWYPEIVLIKSNTNIGFAKGNNLGLSYATGKYILLLNSDTYLKDNAILGIFKYMENHPEAGAVSARLIFPDGKLQAVAQRFPSIKYQLIELFRLQKLMPAKKAGRLLLGAFFDHRETVKADWVWGACFMFPKSILSQLPGNKLDDTYFMYYEDVQWCMDFNRLGYEIHFFAGAEIVHLMGGSSGKKNEMMLQNGNLFLKKNYPVWQIKWIKQLENWLKP